MVTASRVLLAWGFCHYLPIALLAENASKKPNVVFILVDDLGWMDLGCQGIPEKAQELLDMLHRWREAIGAKMPELNPDFFGD